MRARRDGTPVDMIPQQLRLLVGQVPDRYRGTDVGVLLGKALGLSCSWGGEVDSSCRLWDVSQQGRRGRGRERERKRESECCVSVCVCVCLRACCVC